MEDKAFGSSVVYFVLAEGTNRVKIGVSDEFDRRIQSLQSQSAIPLKVLGTIPGDRSVEQRLHKKFAALRLHGEWFRLEWEIDHYISRVCRGHRPRTSAAPQLVKEEMRRRLCNRIGRRRFFLEAQELFGDRWRNALRVQLEIKPTTISKWEKGILPVPQDMVDEVHAAYVDHHRRWKRLSLPVQKTDSAFGC